MSDITENRKELDQAAILIALSGLASGILWIVIATTSVLDMSAGWIVHIVLTVFVWIQIAHVSRTSMLKPLAWVFFVLAISFGVVAYTLNLTGVSTTIVSLFAGVAGGGFLITALVIR